MSPTHLLPAEGDNVAIVTRDLADGETITIGDTGHVLRHRILAGHRIAVADIAAGQDLLSWGLPFGRATVDIAAGDYICNAKMREVLALRHPEDFPVGPEVNFVDRDTTAERLLPAEVITEPNRRTVEEGSFLGYRRGTIRGWGTRNYIAVIGVTSRSTGVVLDAVERLREELPAQDEFDGVVPLVHTEGGGDESPRNLELLVRSLAGFATNPNLAAAILVNEEESAVTNAMVLAALQALPFGASEYTVRFALSRGVDPRADVDDVVEVGRGLHAGALRRHREPAPMSGLKLGLQCGGSDAFSGVTANQVLGRAVHGMIERGGIAGLAETDELIGAEAHVLARVADQSAFDDFLARQQDFKDYAAAHGQTAEGNVSGGNIYRGLYNITLKSIGAGRKKDPATALDRVIGYGEPMIDPGYYFMDSPGNDLESIAGQVSSGANMILFTTGNGSITNHPFVPTIKIVTTPERFELLESDMDFGAGDVLAGESFDASARKLLDLTLAASSGTRTKGEGSGQSQTQIWRSWHRALGQGRIDEAPETFTGRPVVPSAAPGTEIAELTAALPRYALVLPTSLCSGQVAERIVAGLDADDAEHSGPPRYIALPHTEGCGVSGGNAEDLLRDTVVGYATHPLVKTCVFLEHGCEKTHNDFFREALDRRGRSAEDFGWASIQLQGGIDAVERHVRGLFPEAWSREPEPSSHPTIGLASAEGALEDGRAGFLVRMIDSLLGRGFSVVLPHGDPLTARPEFARLSGEQDAPPTLAYAQPIEHPGLHLMDTSTSDWLENATGMGASGAACLVTAPARAPWQPHRMVPTVQLGSIAENPGFDHALEGLAPESEEALERVQEHLLEVLLGRAVPVTAPRRSLGFQISRGRFGVSL